MRACGHRLARVGTGRGLCLHKEGLVWGVLASYQLQAWSPLSDILLHCAQCVCPVRRVPHARATRLMLRAEAKEGAPLFLFLRQGAAYSGTYQNRK